MKKIIILGLITICFSGASLNNRAGVVVNPPKQEIKNTITIEHIPDKLHELDSLMIEIDSIKNGRK